jgi:hypothetical protein
VTDHLLWKRLCAHRDISFSLQQTMTSRQPAGGKSTISLGGDAPSSSAPAKPVQLKNPFGTDADMTSSQSVKHNTVSPFAREDSATNLHQHRSPPPRTNATSPFGTDKDVGQGMASPRSNRPPSASPFGTEHDVVNPPSVVVSPRRQATRGTQAPTPFGTENDVPSGPKSATPLSPRNIPFGTEVDSGNPSSKPVVVKPVVSPFGTEADAGTPSSKPVVSKPVTSPFGTEHDVPDPANKQPVKVNTSTPFGTEENAAPPGPSRTMSKSNLPSSNNPFTNDGPAVSPPPPPRKDALSPFGTEETDAPSPAKRMLAPANNANSGFSLFTENQYG